jgi:hypothetical protein
VSTAQSRDRERTTLGKIDAGVLDDDQTRPLQILAASVIARSPLGICVMTTVVLTDQPGLGIEQIRAPEQTPTTGVQPSVQQRMRESGVEHPHHP